MANTLTWDFTGTDSYDTTSTYFFKTVDSKVACTIDQANDLLATTDASNICYSDLRNFCLKGGGSWNVEMTVKDNSTLADPATYFTVGLYQPGAIASAISVGRTPYQNHASMALVHRTSKGRQISTATNMLDGSTHTLNIVYNTENVGGNRIQLYVDGTLSADASGLATTTLSIGKCYLFLGTTAFTEKQILYRPFDTDRDLYDAAAVDYHSISISKALVPPTVSAISTTNVAATQADLNVTVDQNGQYYWLNQPFSAADKATTIAGAQLRSCTAAVQDSFTISSLKGYIPYHATAVPKNTLGKVGGVYTTSYTTASDYQNSQVLYMNGTNVGYYDFGTFPSWVDGDANALWSISMWVKSTSNSGKYQYPFAFWTGTSQACGIRVNNDNTMQIAAQTGTLSAVSVVTLTTHEWHHLVLTKSGADYALYLDGASATTFNNSTTWPKNQAARLYLGVQAANAADFWEGHIKDWCLWDVELTGGDVSALYNGGNKADVKFTLPARRQNLYFCYWLSGNNTDFSAYDRTLTYNNGTWHTLDLLDPTVNTHTVGTITDTGCTVTFQSSEAGFGWVYVSTNASETRETIIASGILCTPVLANTNFNQAITGLTASTSYYSHLLLEDNNQNQGTVSAFNFSTIAGGGGFSNTKSLDLDGTAQYATNTSATGLVGETFTMCCWFKADTLTGTHSLMTQNLSTNTCGVVVSSTALIFKINDNNVISHSYTVNTGQWYHIAADYYTNNVRFYINGSFVTDVAGSGHNGHSPDRINIGASNRTTAISEYFDGHIDEASYWNLSLSASDIELIYNGGVASDLSSLALTSATYATNCKGWWRMESETTGVVSDEKSLNDLTLQGSPSLVADVP